MSVRAYKIIKMEYSQDPSFNMWHDTEINDWLADGGYLDSYDGGGIIELPKVSIKELIEYLKDKDEYKEVIKQLKQDINTKDEYISYMCF